MSTETIISESHHARHPHFLSRLPNGKYRAGRSSSLSRTFVSAEAVAAEFIEAAMA